MKHDVNTARLNGFERRAANAIALLFLLSFAASGALAAQTVGETRSGFHYDAKTNRFFTDGKTEFKLRPIGNAQDLERIEVSMDEQPFEVYTGKLSFKKEGLHELRFRAVDPVLNWSPLQDFRIYVDQSPPTSSPLWQGEHETVDGRDFAGPGATLTLLSHDSLSGVKQVLMEEGGKITPFREPIVAKAGEHSLRFAGIDFVGNQEPWKEIKYSVDSVAPVTEISFTGASFRDKDRWYVTGEALVTLTGKENLSGLKETVYQINGGPVSVYHAPFPLTQTQNEIKFRSVDKVGNKESWKVLTLYQDTTPPTVTYEKAGTFFPIGGRIFCAPGFAFNISARDSESGLAEMTFALDGKTFQKVNNGKVSFSTAGEYHLLFRSSDRVGNLVEVNPAIVIVDQEPPVTEMRPNSKLVLKDGVYLSPIPNQIEFASADIGVGVDRIEVSFDGKEWASVKGAIDLAQWPVAKRTVHFRGVDRLGNREKPRTLAVHVRSEAPKLELMIETENFPEVPLSSLRTKKAGDK